MRKLVILAAAAALLAGCAGAYVAGDVGAHTGDPGRQSGPR